MQILFFCLVNCSQHVRGCIIFLPDTICSNSYLHFHLIWFLLQSSALPTELSCDSHWFLCLMAYQQCRLFNANAILLEEQLWYYLTHSWEDKRVHTFPKGICPKVNVIARLQYELAYYDSAVHRFNRYTTRTPPYIFSLQIFIF